jgi:DNA repair protein RadD
MLRPYQLKALSALESYWLSSGAAALIDMATATGKSLVLAEIMRREIAAEPSMRVLLAVHVRELVEQCRGPARDLAKRALRYL